jgi:hypothetical protein
LKTVAEIPPVALRAAQSALPVPSAVQLGAEVTVPAIVFQPDHAVPFH